MKRITSLFLAAVVALLGQQSLAATIKVAYETSDNFPEYIGSSAVIPDTKRGYVVDMVEMAAKELGHDVEFVRYPWKRCLAELKEGKIDVLFTASYKDKRKEFGRYPMKDGKPDEARAVANNSYHMYRKTGTNASWDGNAFSNVKVVGAPAGYSIIEKLEKNGLKVEESSQIPGMFKKLAAGRLDGAVTLTVSDKFLTKNGVTGVEQVEPAIVSKPYYVMQSHQFAETNAALSEALWDKIAELRDTKKDEIMAKYAE